MILDVGGVGGRLMDRQKDQKGIMGFPPLQFRIGCDDGDEFCF